MSFQVCEPLYSANFNSKTKVNVNQGGTSSAKTYTILQVLFYIAANTPNQVITVAGQDIPNLKKGAIRDSGTIMNTAPFLQMAVKEWKNSRGYNKTERVYEFKNGSIIEFNSYDNEQDAKSGKRDYLFMNEANGIDYMIYFQLAIRTRKKVYIDYNPTARFWVHEKLLNADNLGKTVSLFISDHRHNRFLSKELHDEIEDLINVDKELWRVYARGLTGAIHGLIYPRFSIIDEMPGIFTPKYGLDFGFNHQTVLMEVAHDANRLFWNELIYQNQLTIGDLIPMMKELNLQKKVIYADHAAPDKIEDLNRAGFNVQKADKDVKNGIDFVKRNSLYVTKRSSGTRQELLSYKYKTKEVNGIVTTLDEPVKFKDDAMDAGRYGSYTGFRKPKGMVIGETGGRGDTMTEADLLEWT